MKKQTKNMLAVLGVVLVVIGSLWYFGTGWIGAGSGKPLDVTSTTTTTGNQPAQLFGGACTQALAKAQTLDIAGRDADRQGTPVTGIATVVFSDEKAGTYLNGNVTTPGLTYSLLASKSSYLKGHKTVTTSCTQTDPQIQMALEAYDGSASVVVLNNDGRTVNAVNTQNQSLVAASPVTLQIEITPSALYKHLAGGVAEGQTGKFAVFFNYTNSSDWDKSGFSISKYGPWGTGSCTPYNGISPVYTGVVVASFICDGDFTGKDVAKYGLYATVKPSSIYANGPKSVLSVNIVPVDYYQNTVSGALETGPVKDDGSAIQTPIQKGIGLA